MVALFRGALGVDRDAVSVADAQVRVVLVLCTLWEDIGG